MWFPNKKLYPTYALCQVLDSSVVAPDAAAIAKTALDRLKLGKASDMNGRESRKLERLRLRLQTMAV